MNNFHQLKKMFHLQKIGFPTFDEECLFLFKRHVEVLREVSRQHRVVQIQVILILLQA